MLFIRHPPPHPRTIRHEKVSISGHFKRFQLNDLLSHLTKLANIFWYKLPVLSFLRAWYLKICRTDGWNYLGMLLSSTKANVWQLTFATFSLEFQHYTGCISSKPLWVKLSFSIKIIEDKKLQKSVGRSLSISCPLFLNRPLEFGFNNFTR